MARSPQRRRPLLERWDGRAWRVVPGALRSGVLAAVSGRRNDVWAVGYDRVAGDPVPIAEHWNGKRWTSVETPAGSGVFRDAALLAAGLLVLQHDSDGGAIVRYDGTGWSTVARVPAGTVDVIGNAMAARAADDVWVVDTDTAAHWDGTRWKTTDLFKLTPQGEGADPRVWDVSMTAKDGWAVGDMLSVESHVTYALLYHWDGQRWKLADARPDTGAYAVTALSPRDAWALVRDPANLHMETWGPPRVLHWDGTKWSPLARPTWFKGADLAEIAARSPTELWIVGSKADSALVARYACAS